MTPSSYRAGGEGARVVFSIASCDLGVLLVAATARGLCLVTIADTTELAVTRLHTELPRAEITRDDEQLGPLLADVLGRIEGDAPARDLPLDVQGTAFQRRVWEALIRIPRGQVRTYGEVAAAIGAPRAVRAVGSACGANPVPVVVPCHRVVPAAGGVGNYGLGPHRKEALLAREGAEPPPHASGARGTRRPPHEPKATSPSATS